MRSMGQKVLIPTAGKGVALGEITDYINKALVKVGKKPALSYIIELYPDDTEFVITTGYFGDQVRDFLRVAYPDKRITLVSVDPYQGEGSSIIYSMLQAKELLQCPFIYHVCDSLLLDYTPPQGKNWIAGVPGDGSTQYAGFTAIGSGVEKMSEKGTIHPDYLHIGVVGIEDYQQFWRSAQELYDADPTNQGLGDITLINTLLHNGVDFSVYQPGRWYDTGNVDGLMTSRAELPDSFHILDKLEESIYIFDNEGYVIKFFANKETTNRRVERTNHLAGLVPKIRDHQGSFFSYAYAEGKLYSKSAHPTNFQDFLVWAQANLWVPCHEVEQEEFERVCDNFYQEKTRKRIAQFLGNHELEDSVVTINGMPVPSISEILEQIDFSWLSKGKQQTHFHGDFILDNIVQTEQGFTLLDRRQDFGGLLEAGDMYYDLAKLNHNLTINHDIVNHDLFIIDKQGSNIIVDIHRRELLVECQQILHAYIREQGLDLDQVRVLTGLIWLNMSPLHHHPFDKFLFYFGKYNLWKALQERN